MVVSGISGKHWVALSSFDFCSLLLMLFMVILCYFIRHLRHHHPGIKIDTIQVRESVEND